MKYFLALVMALAISMPAFSQEYTHEENRDFCQKMALTAYSVLTQKANGLTEEEIVDQAVSNGASRGVVASPNDVKLLTKLVHSIYPYDGSPEDGGSAAYMGCMEQYGEL